VLLLEVVRVVEFAGEGGDGWMGGSESSLWRRWRLSEVAIDDTCSSWVAVVVVVVLLLVVRCFSVDVVVVPCGSGSGSGSGSGTGTGSGGGGGSGVRIASFAA
jgi:hypothetical protein